MNLSDQRTISADRATVWAALLNPDVLKACIPGCQEVTGSAEDGFEAVVVQKVGPVKATFKGDVTVSDIAEGESLTLSGQGKGGPAGYAKGDAKIKLSDADDGETLMEYEVDAKVGGKLAQLGSRIIDGFSKKLADQFFERFQAGLDPEPDTEDEDEDDTETKRGWIGRMFSK